MRTLACVLLLNSVCSFGVFAQPLTRQIEPVPFSQVQINDIFWKPRIEKVQTATLPVCMDYTENKTGRIRNFEKAARKQGTHEGIYFDDSDVYKVIEGIAYTLKTNRDAALERKADEWIDKIAAAQQPDGYLNTYYTLKGLDQRWTDMEKHEDYCAGHLIEAAVAYYEATGKRKLLDVAIRFANHIDEQFRLKNKHWVVGHQEPELALVKLYDVTKDERYLKLSEWLLEQRGHGHGRGVIWSDPHFNGASYCQDDVPVNQITDIKGHAVRAMYLYTGMADVAAKLKRNDYVLALKRVWADVVERNMYITGGIGSSAKNEGFTDDYDLPNESAYCETCASVGMVYWNQRMNGLLAESKYVDVLERSLYNGALAGVQLTGDLFFYVNPLSADGRHHRRPWYGTACCPSNVSRLMPSVGGYVYGTSAKGLWVNLFLSNTAKVPIAGQSVTLSQQTNYPWDGHVSLTLNPTRKSKFELRLRIPAWCKAYSVAINGQKLSGSSQQENGYLVLKRTWQANDVVTLDLAMPVEVVAADPRVKANVGKRAIQRGPLVYCVEEVDNSALPWKDIAFDGSTQFEVVPQQTQLNGATMIKATTKGQTATLIPYYAWDNRRPGHMKVWIDYKE